MRQWMTAPAVVLALVLAAACGGNGGVNKAAVEQGDSTAPWGLSVARSTARWAGNGDIVADMDVDGGATRLEFSLWKGDQQVWCCFELKPQPDAEPRLLNFTTTIALPHDVKVGLDPSAEYRLGIQAYRADALLTTLDARVTGAVPEIAANW